MLNICCCPWACDACPDEGCVCEERTICTHTWLYPSIFGPHYEAGVTHVSKHGKLSHVVKTQEHVWERPHLSTSEGVFWCSSPPCLCLRLVRRERVRACGVWRAVRSEGKTQTDQKDPEVGGGEAETCVGLSVRSCLFLSSSLLRSPPPIVFFFFLSTCLSLSILLFISSSTCFFSSVMHTHRYCTPRP